MYYYPVLNDDIRAGEVYCNEKVFIPCGKNEKEALINYFTYDFNFLFLTSYIKGGSEMVLNNYELYKVTPEKGTYFSSWGDSLMVYKGSVIDVRRADGKKVKWKSTDKDCVKVLKNGKIKAVGDCAEEGVYMRDMTGKQHYFDVRITTDKAYILTDKDVAPAESVKACRKYITEYLKKYA